MYNVHRKIYVSYKNKKRNDINESFLLFIKGNKTDICNLQITMNLREAFATKIFKIVRRHNHPLIFN